MQIDVLRPTLLIYELKIEFKAVYIDDFMKLS